MRVIIQPSADDDLSAIFDWIAKRDPIAAEKQVRRLVQAATRLKAFPERGASRPEIADGA